MSRSIHTLSGHLARNGVAYVALFFALAGSAFAAGNASCASATPLGET